MKTLILFFVSLVILWPSVTFDASADVIYLKNKRSLEGIIKEETDEGVVIEIGIGTVTIGKGEIESIERAGEEEQESLIKKFKKKDIEKGAFAPPSLKELSDRFQNLKRSKRKVDAMRSQSASLKEQFNQKRDKFNSLMSTFDAKNIELRNLDPGRDVKYYNKVVSDVNSLSARLSELADTLKDLNERLPESSRAVQKSISDYTKDLYDFKIYFEEELRSSEARLLTEDEIYFYDTVKDALAGLERNLRKHTIALSKSSGGLLTEVMLNDKVSCVMIVDTGASVVSITRDIAGQLGMDLSGAHKDVELILADGSLVKAKAVSLKSVRVGDSKAEDVLAVVVDNPPAPGVDGLLGMSFLGNFSVRVDSANNELILETIK